MRPGIKAQLLRITTHPFHLAIGSILQWHLATIASSQTCATGAQAPEVVTDWLAVVES